MRVDEAVEIAGEWVREHGSRLPGFVGAHLAGSISQLPRDAILLDPTDIDIFCVMEDGKEFSQRKFLFHGALMETVARNVKEYSSAEELLSSPYGAHHLAADSVLADPKGLLTRLNQRVKVEFPERRWVRARSTNARSIVQQTLDRMGEATSLNNGLMELLWLVLHLCGFIVVSSRGMPTVRKCLVRAREALQATGQPALAIDLLRVAGSSHMSQDQAQLCLDRWVPAFDRALEVFQTRFAFDFNICPYARSYMIDGAQQMIDAGDHREAIFVIAAMHSFVNKALQNDAPVTERARWQTSFDQLQHDLMLVDLAAYRARVALARTVSQELFAWADQIVESRSDGTGSS